MRLRIANDFEVACPVMNREYHEIEYILGKTLLDGQMVKVKMGKYEVRSF